MKNYGMSASHTIGNPYRSTPHRYLALAPCTHPRNSAGRLASEHRLPPGAQNWTHSRFVSDSVRPMTSIPAARI
jgi:hypothetical protein